MLKRQLNPCLTDDDVSDSNTVVSTEGSVEETADPCLSDDNAVAPVKRILKLIDVELIHIKKGVYKEKPREKLCLRAHKDFIFEHIGGSVTGGGNLCLDARSAQLLWDCVFAMDVRSIIFGGGGYLEESLTFCCMATYKQHKVACLVIELDKVVVDTVSAQGRGDFLRKKL